MKKIYVLFLAIILLSPISALKASGNYVQVLNSTGTPMTEISPGKEYGLFVQLDSGYLDETKKVVIYKKDMNTNIEYTIASVIKPNNYIAMDSVLYGFKSQTFVIADENVNKTIEIYARYYNDCPIQGTTPYCYLGETDHNPIKVISTATNTTTTTNTNTNNTGSNNPAGQRATVTPVYTATGDTCTVKGIQSLPGMIKCYMDNIIKLILFLAGVGSVVMIIYSGVLFMTSAGDSKKSDTAKKALTAAVVGLLIVVLAYSISNFVISRINKNYGGSGASTDIKPVPPEGTAPSDQLYKNLQDSIDTLNAP